MGEKKTNALYNPADALKNKLQGNNPAQAASSSSPSSKSSSKSSSNSNSNNVNMGPSQTDSSNAKQAGTALDDAVSNSSNNDSSARKGNIFDRMNDHDPVADTKDRGMDKPS